MKKIFHFFSVTTRYYLVTMLAFFVFWGALVALKFEFLNILFFVLAYVWHLTLQTPGLKEKMLINHHRFSFLNVVVRVNYYLQLFIKIEKYPFGPSIIRALSPLLFTLLLMLVGGSGNVFFTILGSVVFECIYYFIAKKFISTSLEDRETPPAIPSEEKPLE